MCRQSATVCLIKSPDRAERELPLLADRLFALPHPGDRRGRRDPLAAVLLTAACAVLAGARSYLAIGQWARHAPQHALARLGFPPHGVFGVRTAPSTSTVRRVLLAVCPGGLADLLGTDPTGTDTIAVDGKTARGSRTHTAPAAHLLAAVTGTGRTVTQLRVPAKTNEVTALRHLLAPFDLTGVTVTADALHTQRDHARHLVEDRKAHYLLRVKGNQPRLHAALPALPWQRVRARYDREPGHGRRETRSLRVLTVTDLHLDFPHVLQAAKILRHRTDARTGKVSRQTVYAITDLTALQASPQTLARLTRSHWTIENRLHFVRDTAFAEDSSKIRTGHCPANMATLRNLAIDTLRAAGHTGIAAGLREVSYAPHSRPLDLLNLP